MVIRRTCFQIAAKPLQIIIDMVTDSLQKLVIAVFNGTIADPLRSTYRLVTIAHDWHSKVRNDPSGSSTVFVSSDRAYMRLPIIVINSNLGPISHRF